MIVGNEVKVRPLHIIISIIANLRIRLANMLITPSNVSDGRSALP